MDRSRRHFTLATAGLLASAAFAGPALAQGGVIEKISEGGEDLWLALEAYAYLYPLATMEMTAGS